MIELDEVIANFDKASFVNTKNIKHVAEFQSRINNRFIYVDRDSLLNNRLHLVMEEALSTNPSWIPASISLGDRYHNSNMRQFDTRLHRGKKPIHYGVSITAANISPMSDFLRAFNTLR